LLAVQMVPSGCTTVIEVGILQYCLLIIAKL
jgi:hypothetical protein